MNKAGLITAGATLGILLSALTQASANPVTIDSERRPVRMIAEDVTATVGPKVSLVKGVYRFQQFPDDWPEKKDKYVVVFAPWFASDRDVAGTSAPVVKVNGVSIPPREWHDLTLEGDPSETWEHLQKGFSFIANQYAVPLDRIGKAFELTVEYSQANFPGQVAAYLPINPPTKTGSGRVTFVAQPGYALKPFAARNFWNPGFSSLSYVPKDRELLRVKCVNKAERN